MTARTWLVTGGGRGIGGALVEQLLEAGERVAATARDPAALDALAARHGERLWRAALDMADGPAIGRVVDAAFAAFGTIDVIVSNAGYALFGAAEEPSEAEIEAQIAVNLMGSVRLVRAALPHLRAQGRGRIVQVSSMGAQISFPGLGYYHLTKWGLEGFYGSLAQDVAPLGIGITLVEPGNTRTSFSGASATMAAAMPAYRDTPAGGLRAYLETDPRDQPNDPGKVAAAIIASVEVSPAPYRVVLGDDAYGLIHAELAGRLDALEAQRALAGTVLFTA